MKKIILLVLFAFCLSSFASDFKWNHSYQEESSKELIWLANSLAGQCSVKITATEGFAVERPAFSLKCGKGAVSYDIDDQKIIRGIYFEGEAKITFTVADKIEQDHLEKYIGKRSLENESVGAIYILPLGSCPDLPKPAETLTTANLGQSLATLKSALRRDGLKTLCYILNSQKMESNDILILFEFKGDTWAYTHNSLLENEVQLLRFSHPLYSDYYMWDPAVALHIKKGGGFVSQINEEEFKSKIDLDVRSYELDYIFGDGGNIKKAEAKVKIRFNKPSKALIFYFFPGFKVNAVTVDGEESLFAKEGFSRTYGYYETALLVAFPREKTGEATLVFDLSGDLFDNAEGYVYLIDEDLWFPNIEDWDGATFSFKATVPEGFEVISTGDSVTHSINSDKSETYLWKMETPIRHATFTIGKFIHKTLEVEGTVLDVALPSGLRTNILTQAQGYTLNELKNIFLFYSNSFGKLPYTNLKVAITPYSYGRAFKWRGFSLEKERKPADHTALNKTIPVDTTRHIQIQNREAPASIELSSYGRGFPTFILLTENAFFRSGETSPEKLLAHQVALQWWDNLINPLSQKDIWLSEGMSEFSALLYLEARFGGKRTRIFRENVLTGGSLSKRGGPGATIGVDEHPTGIMENSPTILMRTDSAFEATAESIIPFDEGPICLGSRIFSTSSTQPSKNYENIICNKSSFVFGMLFSLSKFTKEGADGFFNGLRSICANNTGKKISTETFFKGLESGMKIPLDGYLTSWYQSNGIPTIEVKTTISQKEGNYLLTAEGKTDSDIFFAVPVRVNFKDKREADYILLFQNKSAKGEWPLSNKPKNVKVDPTRVVFCKYGKVKN